MICPSCGTGNEEGVRFCAKCGTPQDGNELPKASVRNRAQTLYQGSGNEISSMSPLPGPPPVGAGQPAPEGKAPPASGALSPAQVAMHAQAADSDPASTLSLRPPRAANSAKAASGGTGKPAIVAAAPPPQSKMPSDFNSERTPTAPVELDLVGKLFNNRYLIKERIGEGGFGAVYRAEHTQMGRVCALKVLHPRMARDPQVVGRFRREAQAASVLKDGHTVQIYDFDQDQDGIFYLAMELVEGRSLHYEIASGAVPMRRAAHILHGIAQSLGEAHRHGIVHRDIKPENILLEERPNDPDFVKVLDFGIAKIARGSNLQGGPALTAAGQTLGTVEYMSPEQLMGLELDGRSDLYALGVLAYEMLTGSLPFTVRTTAEMISAHLKMAPQPPSQHSPKLGITPEMDAIVLKLLEKKRERRYADTAELQADLQRILGGGQPAMTSAAPSVAAASRSAAPSSSPAPASKTLLIAGVVVAVVGILVVAYLLLVGKASAEEPPAAPARLVPEEFVGMLGVDVTQLRAASPQASVDLVLNAAKESFREIGADPAQLGSLALGFLPPPAAGKRPSGVVIADLPVDGKQLEKRMQGPLRTVLYKDVTIRSGKAESYAVLPGGRLVMGTRYDLAKLIDVAQGQKPALVEGAAAALLERVGAMHGRGPALFGWLRIGAELRGELQQTGAPALGKLEELAGSLATGAQGADARLVGRCASAEDAKATETLLRGLVAQAAAEPAVGMLGLRQMVEGIRVMSEGPMVSVSLHLSQAEYSDLVTRLAGLVASAVQQYSPLRPGAREDAAPSSDKPAAKKTSPRSKGKTAAH